MTEDFTARNEQIIDEIGRAGKRHGVFQEVADKHGISRARVYAIWARAKKPQQPKRAKAAPLTGRLPGVSVDAETQAILERMVVELGWETMSHAVRLAVGILALTDCATLESQARARKIDPAALAAKAINKFLTKGE